MSSNPGTTDVSERDWRRISLGKRRADLDIEGWNLQALKEVGLSCYTVYFLLTWAIPTLHLGREAVVCTAKVYRIRMIEVKMF